jgi:outer membrane protein, heavy metal efflux system
VAPDSPVQSAQADVDKRINQIENQVDVAYQNLVHSRRLVEAYLAGILEDSGLAFTIAAPISGVE